MTRRLLLSYLSITVVVLAALGVPLGFANARAERRQLTAGLQHDALALAIRLEGAVRRGEGGVVRSVAERYQGETGARVVVVDRSGTALADTAPPRPGTRAFASRPEVAAALAGREVTGTRHSALLDQRLLYVAVPVVHEGAPVGAIRLTYPTTVVDDRVRRAWLAIAALGVAVTGAVTVASVGLARLFTRPVRDLEVAAARLGAGDLGARVPVPKGPPELVRLAASFNRTAVRLEELVGAQEAFVADASHQLRTPLAALRLRLENLVAEAGPSIADEVEGALAEVHRLSRLVDGLLTLARTERAAAPAAPYDATDVAQGRVEAWRAFAEERGVRLNLEAAGPVVAHGVADGLEQVLDNLIANALEASPRSTTVTVTVTVTDRDRVAVVVADQGPGMSPEQRARAFDRFWRAPDARPGAGSGLGLAIVARLVARDGGDVRLDDAPGGGLAVTVRLPAARP